MSCVPRFLEWIDTNFKIGLFIIDVGDEDGSNMLMTISGAENLFNRFSYESWKFKKSQFELQQFIAVQKWDWENTFRFSKNVFMTITQTVWIKMLNRVEPMNYSKIWNQLLSRLFQQLTRTIISPPDLILKGCFIVVNSLNQCPKCYVLTIGLELAVKTRD